jgi:hypothetical protein
MSSRSTNEVTPKEDIGYSEQKNPYWREEPLSTVTQSGRQKDLDDKSYTYPSEKNIPSVYYKEYKMTSRRAYQGNGINDEEAVLDESHFDYII